MAVLGKTIIISLNGQPIAAVKSDDVQTKCDLLEVSDASEGSWRHYRNGRKSWELTTGYLVSSMSDLLNVGTTYTVTVGSGGPSGSAILETCRITASVGSVLNGSFRFRGNGPLGASS